MRIKELTPAPQGIKLFGRNQFPACARVLDEFRHAFVAVEFRKCAHNGPALGFCTGKSHSFLQLAIRNINCRLHDGNSISIKNIFSTIFASFFTVPASSAPVIPRTTWILSLQHTGLPKLVLPVQAHVHSGSRLKFRWRPEFCYNASVYKRAALPRDHFPW